jgi:pyrroloquinoline quinone biosynthesis protein D
MRHDSVRGCDLLLLPEGVVTLNESAAAVLRLCDGSRSARRITDELQRRFDEPRLPGDVARFLDRMRREGWVR